MVVSTSRRAKRQTRWCYRSMDRSLEHLKGLQDIFAEDHEDYAEFLELVMRAQLHVQRQLEEFYRLAWGRVPKDWYVDS